MASASPPSPPIISGRSFRGNELTPGLGGDAQHPWVPGRGAAARIPLPHPDSVSPLGGPGPRTPGGPWQPQAPLGGLLPGPPQAGGGPAAAAHAQQQQQQRGAAGAGPAWRCGCGEPCTARGGTEGTPGGPRGRETASPRRGGLGAWGSAPAGGRWAAGAPAPCPGSCGASSGQPRTRAAACGGRTDERLQARLVRGEKGARMPLTQPGEEAPGSAAASPGGARGSRRCALPAAGPSPPLFCGDARGKKQTRGSSPKRRGCEGSRPACAQRPLLAAPLRCCSGDAPHPAAAGAGGSGLGGELRASRGTELLLGCSRVFWGRTRGVWTSGQ